MGVSNTELEEKGLEANASNFLILEKDILGGSQYGKILQQNVLESVFDIESEKTEFLMLLMNT